MAVAIIRQLTLAQVQAAIDAGSTSWNNNYAGTQVYVTDKDWHLACYLDRVAKPLSGVLKINNGDTLPAWLTPETLLIDTGSFTDNLSLGNKVITPIPAGYYVTAGILTIASIFTGDVTLVDAEGNVVLTWTVPQAAGYFNVSTVGGSSSSNYYAANTGNYEIGCGEDETGAKQMIIEMKRKNI